MDSAPIAGRSRSALTPVTARPACCCCATAPDEDIPIVGYGAAVVTPPRTAFVRPDVKARGRDESLIRKAKYRYPLPAHSLTDRPKAFAERSTARPPGCSVGPAPTAKPGGSSRWTRAQLRRSSLLVKMGYKNHKKTGDRDGFRRVADPDYDFTRKLMTRNLIPTYVTRQVLTQLARGEIPAHVRRVEGVSRRSVHL